MQPESFCCTRPLLFQVCRRYTDGNGSRLATEFGANRRQSKGGLAGARARDGEKIAEWPVGEGDQRISLPASQRYGGRHRNDGRYRELASAAVAEDVFHIIALDELRRAMESGEHRPRSLDDVGYVHLSGSHQVLRPANLLYRGRNDLWLLRIDPDRLPAERLRWEPGAHGESEDFPHLYAPLPLRSATAAFEFVPGRDGRFERLPGGLQFGRDA